MDVEGGAADDGRSSDEGRPNDEGPGGDASPGIDAHAVAIRAGLAAPVIALSSVLLATVLDPSFSWAGSALSHTGELPPGRSISLGLLADRPSFLLFNGGLIAAGLVGLPFAWLLYVEARHPLERSGAVLLGLSLGSMVAVGVFFLPSGFHDPAAIVHFIATMGTLWIYGVGAAQGGRVRFGTATVVLGLLVLGTWLLWGEAFVTWGIAIPEMVSAVALGGWTFVAAAKELEASERDAMLAGLGEDS